MSVDSTDSNVDSITKKISVSISAEKLLEEYKTELDKLSRTIQLKGFRQGKAPRDLVERLHGSRVRQDASIRLVSTTLEDIIKEKNIKFVGEPAIDFNFPKPGEPLEYTATLSLFPEPEIVGEDDIEVSVPKFEVKDEDVTRVIDKIRGSWATKEPETERTTCQEGDIISVDYKLISTEDVDGANDGKVHSTEIEMTSEGTSEFLLKGLIGLEVGQARVVDVPVEELKSPDAPAMSYEITLKSISNKVLPDVDDEFVARVEPELRTVLEFRLKIRDLLEKDMQRKFQARLEDEVVKALVSKNEFAVPQVMVDDEIYRRLAELGIVDKNKPDVKNIMDKYREVLNEGALEKVRAAILIQRLSEKYKVTAEPAEIEEWTIGYAAERQISVEDARKEIHSKRLLIHVMNRVVSEKTVKLVSDKAEVTYLDDDGSDSEENATADESETPAKTKSKKKSTAKGAKAKKVE